MTCFVKVCTEFIPISFDCIIQVDIHAVLDTDQKIWFNKAHKKELLELVLEKAKSRLLQSQTGQSLLDKKERVSAQLRETPPEVVTGKNIKLGISFRKCGVRYNSLLVTSDGLGDAKVYQPLSCFKEKLIVYSYPLDRSFETSNVATALSRHHVTNENIGKNPSTVTEGGVSRTSRGTKASFTHLTDKDSSEGSDRDSALVTPRPQLVSNDISEGDRLNLGAAKKKRSAVEELGNQKKSRRLSEFKFRRTRAIQVLCHHSSPSVKAKIVRRRSRVLGLSCTDKDPNEEDLENRSAVDKASEDVVEKKLDAHLSEKSSDIPEEKNMDVLDHRSIGAFKDRVSWRNSKVVLGKKSTVASIDNYSNNRKSLDLDNVILVQYTGRNEAITSTEINDLKKCSTTLQPEQIEEQDCCFTSHQKKIDDKMNDFCGKAVCPSKKRQHDESDSVASALTVSKKLCTKKSRESQLQSSGAIPRPHTREVGRQCSVTMDRHSEVTGAGAIRSSSDFEARGDSTEGIRWNSNGDIIGVRNSNIEIGHVSARDSRRCSSDDFTQSAIRGPHCESAGNSNSKDCSKGDWKESDVKGNLGKDVTSSRQWMDNNRSVPSTSELCSGSVVVLSNITSQMNQQIIDSDRDFRNTNLKRLPTQKSRRLATKKKRYEKYVEDLNLDSSLVFIDDPLTEKGEIDLESAPSDMVSAPSDMGSAPSDMGSSLSDLGSAASDGCTASSSVDPQKKNCAISKYLSTSAAHSVLEKEVGLSSSVGSQPIAKTQDNGFSSGSIIPLCDASLDNFSNFSTSVPDFIGATSSQSASQNSVTFSENIRLSGSDVATTKSSSRADVIIIDSDEEGDVEAEIKNVREVSDLSTFQLRYLVSSNEKYLRKIFQGKTPCRRHQDYKAGKEKRRALSWNLPVGVFSDEQYSLLLSSLKELFCKDHEKYLDYVMMVLLPEVLVKIFMFIHDLSYEEAESRIEDNAMELSQRNHFSF